MPGVCGGRFTDDVFIGFSFACTISSFVLVFFAVGFTFGVAFVVFFVIFAIINLFLCRVSGEFNRTPPTAVLFR
jgi:hypothetical protein